MADSDKPKLVFLDRDTLDAGDIDFSHLEAVGDLQLHDLSSAAEVPGRIEAAEIVLTNKVVIDATAMDAAPNLKMIQVAATGVNNVDLEAARERGIAVCNVSGYSTPAVAQHTFSLILNLVTNVHRYAAEPEKWAASPFFTRLDYPVVELAGKTLGVAGLGEIGTAVAKIGEAFGMRIVGLSRQGQVAAPTGYERIQKDRFFAESDVISLHCPLTDDTHHLINTTTLDLMKSSAIVVNTGRGDLVDETALIEALRKGRIAGAALDVISEEPPPSNHPMLDSSIPNLILTPHSAWSSRESRRRLLGGVVENIQAFLAGTPVNRVA